eukprot:11225651-Ditylum_brightwellii.AAC.1
MSWSAPFGLPLSTLVCVAVSRGIGEAAALTAFSAGEKEGKHKDSPELDDNSMQGGSLVRMHLGRFVRGAQGGVRGVGVVGFLSNAACATAALYSSMKDA